MIGSRFSEMTIAASSYLEYFHGEITGRPPKIDLKTEKECQSILRSAISKNLVASSHDISDGGLAIALSECCILSSKGATINLQNKSNRFDNLLFAEGGSRIIFSINKNKQMEWLTFLEEIEKISAKYLFKKYRICN